MTGTAKRRMAMARAWAAARSGARRFGGRPAAYLAEALRQAWATVRRIAAESAAMAARVLAEVGKIRAEDAALVRAERESRERVKAMARTMADAAVARARTLYPDDLLSRPVDPFFAVAVPEPEAEDDHPDLRRAMAA